MWTWLLQQFLHGIQLRPELRDGLNDGMNELFRLVLSVSDVDVGLLELILEHAETTINGITHVVHLAVEVVHFLIVALALAQ